MPKKVVGGRYEVDFTYKGRRMRGQIPVETLVALRSISRRRVSIGAMDLS